jgi:hypothetical protein
MSLADSPAQSSAPAGAKPLPVPPRGLVLAALVVLLGFIGFEGVALMREFWALRAEQYKVRTTVAVGYPGITPQYSYARVPGDWYRVEGETVRLWGGWHGESGHHWFLTSRGDIPREQMSEPVGKDAIRAIDHPIVEKGGGRYWVKIPDEANVVGWRLGDTDTAYPMTVLEKVLVVNDVVNERPLLVLTSPYAPVAERSAAYDPSHQGRRLSMGHAGYFHDRRPLLYDRGTESLWVGRADALEAITGPLKGTRLPLLGYMTPVQWSVWRTAHPSSRLIVGADRSKSPPRS